MLKLKKFPSDNTFFLIVFFSILSFLFFIICFFSLSCLFLRSGKRKIVYKKNFAQKSFFSSGVVKESELKKDYVVEKISTKKTIEGDDFSDSYCDGLFQEFFIGHSLNSSQGSSVSVKKYL